MYGRPLLIARLAVAELIDTFSENDFFNLIWVGIQRHHYLVIKRYKQNVEVLNEGPSSTNQSLTLVRNIQL